MEELNKILNQQIPFGRIAAQADAQPLRSAKWASITRRDPLRIRRPSDRLLVLLSGQPEILGEGGTLATIAGDHGRNGLPRPQTALSDRAGQGTEQVLAVGYAMRLIEGDYRLQARSTAMPSAC